MLHLLPTDDFPVHQEELPLDMFLLKQWKADLLQLVREGDIISIDIP